MVTVTWLITNPKPKTLQTQVLLLQEGDVGHSKSTKPIRLYDGLGNYFAREKLKDQTIPCWSYYNK